MSSSFKVHIVYSTRNYVCIWPPHRLDKEFGSNAYCHTPHEISNSSIHDLDPYTTKNKWRQQITFVEILLDEDIIETTIKHVEYK